MAVQHGMNADAYLNGYDAGDWLNNASFSMPRDMNDRTVFNNAGAKVYLPTPEKESTASFSGFYDQNGTTITDTGNKALEDAYDNAIGAPTSTVMFFPSGAGTVGNLGMAMLGAITSFEIEEPVDGLAGVSFEMQSTVGKENVKLLAPLAAQEDTFEGTSLDNTDPSSNGGAGYLQVTDCTSGTLPVIIEHSEDDSVWATLITFTNVTADHSHERVAVSGTVNRYVRAAATGTYVATFAVAFNRK